MSRYLVAAIKPWNREAFEKRSPSLAGDWAFIGDPSELTAAGVKELSPRYLFVPHWSWNVGTDILDATECVGFHPADLPFGRGGSPIQNLIADGHRETIMSAFRLVPELDAGPIYLKEPLSLEGNAQDIFERMADLIWDMIEKIITMNPVPIPQAGEPSYFKRRKPEQSRFPEKGERTLIYDHVRMLDADTYPRAFIEHGEFRIEFSDARIEDDALTARVRIIRDADGND